MSSYISESLRRQVIARAENRCEYCRLYQVGQEATFHIDHVKPVKLGGKTSLRNLALACVSCSLYKSAKEVATDPLTGNDAPIFNPIKQVWDEHFRWEHFQMVGLTPIGRGTIEALKQNRLAILAIRAEEFILGRFP